MNVHMGSKSANNVYFGYVDVADGNEGEGPGMKFSPHILPDVAGISVSWKWGAKHPKTGSRVRMFDRGSS